MMERSVGSPMIDDELKLEELRGTEEEKEKGRALGDT